MGLAQHFCSISELFECKSYLTIGHYKHCGKNLYKFSKRDLRKWIQEPVTGIVNSLDAHTWITLESGEVIDATLPTTLGYLFGKTELYGHGFLGYPQDIAIESNLIFHPMFLGTQEILQDIGVLRIAEINDSDRVKISFS